MCTRVLLVFIAALILANCSNLPGRDSVADAGSSDGVKVDMKTVSKTVSKSASKTQAAEGEKSNSGVKSRAKKSPRSLHANSNIVKSVDDKKNYSSIDQSSRIIFIRSSLVASAVDATLFDVSRGVPKRIACLSNNSKVSYTIPSGQHVFMIMSANSVDFLRLDASGDRTYYGLVKPSMGVWKPSFSLAPIKMTPQQGPSQNDVNALGKDKVQTLLLETAWIKASDEAVLEIGTKVLEQYTKGWGDWLQQSIKQQSANTLNIADGVKGSPYL